MERVSLLINKLKEGVDSGADANRLQMLAQMLLAELQRIDANTPATNVAVVMPYVVQQQQTWVEEPQPTVIAEAPQEAIAEEEAPVKAGDTLPMPPVEAEPYIAVVEPAPPPVVELTPTTVLDANVVADPEPDPVVAQTAVVVEVPTPAPPVVEEKAPEQSTQKVQDFLQSSWLYDTAAENMPTLPTQPDQKVVFELKDTFTQEEQKESSLNDRLKEQKTEVAAKLQGAPIRDLKKAIGINDRFLFINELFRGDEDMYERSIKTINAFSIFPEAEYWIQRELKVKIGWPEDSDVVRQFDHLVKRRFA